MTEKDKKVTGIQAFSVKKRLNQREETIRVSMLVWMKDLDLVL